VFSVLLAVAISTGAESTWFGEFTFGIKGEGSAKGKFKSTAKWKVHREARGTYLLDRSTRGTVCF
jgi:hypothetical protein